jgi:hypothetical protein
MRTEHFKLRALLVLSVSMVVLALICSDIDVGRMLVIALILGILILTICDYAAHIPNLIRAIADIFTHTILH